MTLKTLIAAAGLAFATIGGASAAEAQYHSGWHHDGYREGRWRDHDRYRDGWHRHRGWHRDWRGYHRRCWYEWHHHHRVRRCR